MSYSPTALQLSALNGSIASENVVPDPAPTAETPADPSTPGTLHSFLAGVVNPFSDIANVATQDVINPLTGEVGIPKIPEIPQVSYTPGLAHSLGDVAGFAVPMAGEARLIGAGADVAKSIPRLSSLGALGSGADASRLGQIAKSSLAGAGVGSAVSPGSRGTGAVAGAVGGLLGEGVGQAAGALKSRLSQIGVPARLEKEFLEKIKPFQVNNPSDHLTFDLAKSYTDAKNSVKPLYDNLFDGMRKSGTSMNEADLPNLTDLLKKDMSLRRAIPSAIKTPQEMMVDHNGNGRPFIDPEDVHWLKSQTGGLSKTTKDNEQRISYGKYSNAIKKDLMSFLKSNDRDEEYSNASQEFKKALLPFTGNTPGAKIFSSKIKPFLDMETQVDNGNHFLHLDRVDPTLRSSKVATSLIPAAGEKDMGKIQDLTNMLQSPIKARDHLRNNMLTKHIAINPETNQPQINIKSLLAHESKLSPQQRNFLLHPEEQKTMQALRQAEQILKPTLGGKIGKAAAAASLGSLAASRLGAPVEIGTAAGLLGGIPISNIVGKTLGELLTRGEELPELTKRILSKPKIRRAGKGIPSALGSSTLTPSTQQ